MIMNVTIREISFRGSDKNPAVGWLYQPATEQIRGIIQICHGMTEHMGRYHEFMRYLARSGYIVCGADHPGHGRSAVNGHGFFAPENGNLLLVENQYLFSRIMQKEFPGYPLILFGHSMGSFAARIYAAKYPSVLAGLILSGTGRGHFFLDAAIASARYSVRRHGPRHIDKKLDQFVFGMFNRPFASEHPHSGWLSRDMEQVRLYCNDPACNFTFTVSALRDLLLLVRASNQKNCFSSASKDLHLLVFSGSQDPVGEQGKGVRQVYEHYVAAGVHDAQLNLYEGGRHEMLNEVNRCQVYQDILRWLNQRFPPQEKESLETWEGEW